MNTRLLARLCKHEQNYNLRFFNNSISSSIGVVGGGIAGIGTLKEFKEIGFNDIKLFEYSNDIGGNWDVQNAKGGGYKGMTSNTSYTHWPFSDYIYQCEDHGHTKESHPTYTNIEYVHKHLSNYSKHFDLYKDIEFNSTVTKINKNNNKWEIIVNNNETQKYLFDKIVLCLGTFSSPKYPQHLNIDKMKENFNGNIYHSTDIKKINIDTDVTNKNVLVVGNSVSGCDVSEYLCINNAKFVYNLYREQRVFLRFWQTDNVNNLDESDQTLDAIIMARNGELDYKKFAIYLDKYGFITPDDVDNKVNENKIKFGFVKGFEYFCKKGILVGIQNEIDSVAGNNVYLTNNCQCLKDIDTIIFATGYNVNEAYNKILSKDIIDKFYKPEIKKQRNLLYLLSFITGFEQDNIAFNGANHVISTFTHELQARLIGQVWSGNVKLPSTEIQNEWIQKTLIDYDPFWFLPALSAHPFIDEIAQIIGCLPKQSDYSKEYEYIYDILQNDCGYPSQFRISGPGTNQETKMKAQKELAQMLQIAKNLKKDSKLLQAQVSRIDNVKYYGN